MFGGIQGDSWRDAGKSSIVPNIKIFFWRPTMGRLATYNEVQSMQPNNN